MHRAICLTPTTITQIVTYISSEKRQVLFINTCRHPEEGRYVRGNDYSPVAIYIILDTFNFTIPAELNKLVMVGVDSAAALNNKRKEDA